MKYLKISNNGLLDIRLVYLMGGTTKANDKFKIGQFGTGLKYTLAFMLRNNIDFRIFIDGVEVKLTTQTEVIRDTKFEIICIDNQRTSITTNMGMDWQPWMIIRELWCNALDELDPINEIVDCISPQKGRTEYFIQYIPDIQNVYDNWDKYFIHNKLPIMENDVFAIYDGGESLRCYKQGVLIHESEGKKAVFSYDIKNAELNELRQMLYSPHKEIAECMPDLNSKTIEILLNNIKDTYEETMDYSGWFSKDYSDEWGKAIGNAKFCDYETYRKIINKLPTVITEPVVQVPKSLFKRLLKSFPSISLLRASDKMNEFYETYSDKLHDKVKLCIEILEKSRYYIDPNLRIIYGIFGNKSVKAEVHMDDKEIRLCQDLETYSNFDLISILIEENEHYKTGFHDETREFQTHFIKLYANLLLDGQKVLL